MLLNVWKTRDGTQGREVPNTVLKLLLACFVMPQSGHKETLYLMANSNRVPFKVNISFAVYIYTPFGHP